MKVTVIRPDELGPTELARWHELQRLTPGMDDPFLSPEFTLAVGRALDRARVAVVEDGAEGIVAFLPFERHAMGVGQPIGAELLGTQGLIHAPGLELNLRQLLRGCGLTVWEFTDLPPHQTLLAPYQTGQAYCPVIDVSQGYERWVVERQLHYKKLVKDLEAKTRRMSRDHGEIRFAYDVHASSHDGADVQADLRTLMRWKSGQYRRTGRTDRFAIPWMVRLIEDLAHTRAAACTGVLSMLYAGDKPVAGHFGLANRHTLMHKFPSYDIAYKKYSPGLILNLRLAEAGAAAGLREINLGRGDFTYKHWFKSHDVLLGEGRVTRPAVGTALRWVRREPTRRLAGVVIGNPRLRHAADQTLRLLGRVRTRLAPANASAGRAVHVVNGRAAAEPDVDGTASPTDRRTLRAAVEATAKAAGRAAATGGPESGPNGTTRPASPRTAGRRGP